MDFRSNFVELKFLKCVINPYIHLAFLGEPLLFSVFTSGRQSDNLVKINENGCPKIEGNTEKLKKDSSSFPFQL